MWWHITGITGQEADAGSQASTKVFEKPLSPPTPPTQAGAAYLQQNEQTMRSLCPISLPLDLNSVPLGKRCFSKVRGKVGGLTL